MKFTFTAASGAEFPENIPIKAAYHHPVTLEISYGQPFTVTIQTVQSAVQSHVYHVFTLTVRVKLDHLSRRE